MKSTPLGIRFDPNVRAALTKAAKDDGRSISSLAHKIIADWLRHNNYLNSGPDAEGDTAKPEKSRSAPTVNLGHATMKTRRRKS